VACEDAWVITPGTPSHSPRPGIVYRPANADDCRVLAEMRWEFRVEERPDLATTEDRDTFLRSCEAWIRYRLALGTWTMWVADVALPEGGERRIVSHIFVQLVDTVPKPGKVIDRWGYMTNVYTRPEWRGRGIGGGLLDWVKLWALGADLEFLQVWPAEGAVEFYQRAGFVPEPEALTLQLRPYAG